MILYAQPHTLLPARGCCLAARSCCCRGHIRLLLAAGHHRACSCVFGQLAVVQLLFSDSQALLL